jgi:hypothetical protein
MKKYFSIALIGLISATWWMSQAQSQKGNPTKPPKTVFKGKTFLSGGTISSGKISKKMFDSLIALPLYSQDTAGNLNRVNEFTFTYAERGIFEDSTGKERIMTDYFNQYCEKGVLPEDWLRYVRERSKFGDSAIFQNIISNNGANYHSQPLRLLIVE